MSQDIHSQIVDTNEIHVPKGFTEATIQTVPTKDAGGNFVWIDQGDVGGIGPQGPAGSLATLDVVSAASPTELASYSDDDFGDEVIVRQPTSGEIDTATLYIYNADASNYPASIPPYIMPTSKGGTTRWIAGIGAYAIAGPIATLSGDRYITPAEIEAADVVPSTGISHGGNLSINGGDNTLFDIADGHGVIVDHASDPDTPVYASVKWENITAQSIPDIGTTVQTYIGISKGSLDPADGKYLGVVVQQSTDFTQAQLRSIIKLGACVHTAMVVIEAATTVANWVHGVLNQLSDLAKSIGLINVSGNIFSENGANLLINKSLGETFSFGANYAVDLNVPNSVTQASDIGVAFFRQYRDGSGGRTISVGNTQLDPNNYDDGSGTLATVASNRYSVKRVFLTLSGLTVIAYGQAIYTSLADAEASIQSEPFDKDPNLSNVPLRSWIIVKGNTTDLAAAVAGGAAKFINAGKFDTSLSGTSTATSTLQGAYNNSEEPEIKINTTNGALTVQDNDTPTGGDIFEVKTSAGAALIMGVDIEGTTLNGKLDLIHTSTTSDDHALEIDVTASGFGDVKAIDIDYITGAIPAGAEEGVILVNLDESLSVGGTVSGLEILTTDEGGASVNALVAGVSVNPIKHLSGAFTAPDTGLVNATNRLTEFSSAGSNIQMFIADNDTVTLGSAAKFEEIEVILAITASQNVQPTFEYSTGVGTWSAFTPTDGTNGFLNTGIILWFDSDIPSWSVGTGSEYLIRITRTRNGLATPPTESLIKIAATVQYSWDQNANLKVKSVELDGQAWSENNDLADAANIATDCALGNVHTVTLAGNRTLDNPTNLKDGATYIWVLTQDATGTRTLGYGSAFKFLGGTTPVLTTTALAVDILTGVSDGTNVYCSLGGDFK